MVTNRQRSWVAIAACAIVSLITAGCGTTEPQPGPPLSDAPRSSLVNAVSGAGATPHLQALQRIADENGGNRASLGPGYEASVDYVADVLRAAGYQVSTPTYPATTDSRTGQEILQRNVIAQTQTGDPDRVVMLGAHLDSVRRSPGINDNGSGVAALLEIATKLGGAPQTHNAVRFAFWGSEEDEFQGSRHYVETLSAADRQKIMLYLNLDMLGSPNAGYFVQGGPDSGSSEGGPPGSAKIGQVLTDQLAATGVIPERLDLDGGSDFVSFVDAGIPTGGALTGDEQEKTERQVAKWGGRADEEYDHCYHSACDRIDNVNSVALDRYIDAVAGTLSHFSQSKEPLTR